MRLSVQTPLVGQLARYEGLYCPGHDGGCLLVRVPRRRRLVEGALVLAGLLAAFWLGLLGQGALLVLGGLVVVLVLAGEVERWQPVLPPDGGARLGQPGGLVQFEGWVSSRRAFGPKGMQRTVDILRVACHRGHSERQPGAGQRP